MLCGRKCSKAFEFAKFCRSVTTLRPYQQNCADAILKSLKEKNRPAVSLPTGSGKTRILSYILKHVKPMFQADTFRKKTLVLVNRKELLDQAAKSIKSMYSDINIGYISGKLTYESTDDVVISTYQTLCKDDRLDGIDANDFKLIIIDEAHHTVANSYIKILSKFDAVENTVKEDTGDSLARAMGAVSLEDINKDVGPFNPPQKKDNESRRVHVVGFSATFWREDQRRLADIFDEVCYHESVASLIDEGYLCPAVQTIVKLEGLNFENNNLENQQNDHANFFCSLKAIEVIYNVWRDNPGRTRTVIFGSNLTQLESMCEYFRSRGVDSRILRGNMDKQSRQILIESFANGEFPVILNCQILTEGTDIPAIDQVIIARGLKSKGMAMQMIGRGLRLHEGKENCNVVTFARFHDIVGTFLPNLERNNSGSESSNNTTTTKSEDPDDSLNEKLDNQFTIKNIQVSKDGKLIFASSKYSTPEGSPFKWLNMGKKYYFFPIQPKHKGEYYNVSLIKGIYELAHIIPRNNKFKQRKVLFRSSSLSETTSFADSVINNSVDKPINSTRVARWTTLPWTDKQRQFIEKHIQLEENECLSRGIAHSLICAKSIGMKLTRELIDKLSEPKSKYLKEH